jgi:hypothetical protein
MTSTVFDPPHRIDLLCVVHSMSSVENCDKCNNSNDGCVFCCEYSIPFYE